MGYSLDNWVNHQLVVQVDPELPILLDRTGRSINPGDPSPTCGTFHHLQDTHGYSIDI